MVRSTHILLNISIEIGETCVVSTLWVKSLKRYSSRTILGMGSANKRRRYNETSSLEVESIMVWTQQNIWKCKHCVDFGVCTVLLYQNTKNMREVRALRIRSCRKENNVKIFRVRVSYIIFIRIVSRCIIGEYSIYVLITWYVYGQLWHHHTYLAILYCV